MRPVTALARRRLECVSDLTIDRWLLGETPGSDEARRLEEHMKDCSGCASRIGALRGLYSTQVPPAAQEPPVRLSAPPAAVPGQTGAVQFLILRDGLLVGSEFFTPGTYVIGSDARADLQLDGVMPVHARLYFRDGRVAVKAEGGTVLVSGFKIDSCEVRSIDEVVVGPYVLRTRVIRERWSDVHPEPVTELTVIDPPRESPPSNRSPRAESRGDPLASPPSTPLGMSGGGGGMSGGGRGMNGGAPSRALSSTRLTVELWWGDTRQEARSFEGAVSARDFPLWGLGVSDDFVLATPTAAGTFQVRAPGGKELSLELGATTSFTAGAMRLTLRVDAVLPALPRAKVEGVPVLVLAAAMMMALVAGLGLAPEPEETPFAPKTALRYVTLVPPPPKVKPEQSQGPKSASAEVKAPRPRPSRPSAPRVAAADPFASLKQVLGDRSFKNILAATNQATKSPGKGKPNLFAGLGAPGGKKGFDLGISAIDGIGARGTKNGGAMSGKGYGVGRVGGTVVDRPTGERFGFRGNRSSIDRDAVAKAIMDHLHEVSTCYERALIRNGGEGGKLLLEWTVTTSGTVSTAKVKNTTLKDGSVASCVLTALKGWRFPQSRGGPVVVSYPFIFHATTY